MSVANSAIKKSVLTGLKIGRVTHFIFGEDLVFLLNKAPVNVSSSKLTLTHVRKLIRGPGAAVSAHPRRGIPLPPLGLCLVCKKK